MKYTFIFLFFFLFLPFVVAEGIPFTQCIQVIDMSTGQHYSGLNCTLTEPTANLNQTMTEQNQQYCTRITHDYEPQRTYTYNVTCVDPQGRNRTITSSYYIEQQHTAGTPTLLPTPPTLPPRAEMCAHSAYPSFVLVHPPNSL